MAGPVVWASVRMERHSGRLMLMVSRLSGDRPWHVYPASRRRYLVLRRLMNRRLPYYTDFWFIGGD